MKWVFATINIAYGSTLAFSNVNRSSRPCTGVLRCSLSALRHRRHATTSIEIIGQLYVSSQQVGSNIPCCSGNPISNLVGRRTSSSYIGFGISQLGRPCLNPMKCPSEGVRTVGCLIRASKALYRISIFSCGPIYCYTLFAFQQIFRWRAPTQAHVRG